MPRFSTLTAALTSAAILAGALPASGFDSVEGRWSSVQAESHYDVTLCGTDGADLCAKLIWLGPNERAEAYDYLGSFVLEEAKPAGENAWNGTVLLLGHSINGTVRQISDDRIQINGCAYFIFCIQADLDRL